MTARDRLIETLNEEHNPSYWGDYSRDAEALVDAYRDEVALDMGRDLLDIGLVPFLERLVGAYNAVRVFERHAGEDE